MEKDDTAFILIYLYISEVDLGCAATYEMDFFETIIIASSC